MNFDESGKKLDEWGIYKELNFSSDELFQNNKVNI
jgi:hypothetical protein